MAEVSGLTIGVIALASLFSTCIDLFERFELGANHCDDYELSRTKLCLLKARLRDCGEPLRNDSEKTLYANGRQQLDPSGHVAISRSLLGIKKLFEKAALLEDKYRLSPDADGAGGPLTIPKPAVRYKRLGKGLFFTSCSGQTSLRKRTIWAVHDKTKLDRFLNDLDFLIRNLEHIMATTSKTETQRGISDILNTIKAESLEDDRPLVVRNSAAGKESDNENVRRNEDNPEKAENGGSQYRTVVQAGGFSHVHLGDIGTCRAHVFKSQIYTSDNASVQLGNRTAAFELARERLRLPLQVELKHQRRTEN